MLAGLAEYKSADCRPCPITEKDEIDSKELTEEMSSDP